MIPQAFHELPGGALILRVEQAAGNGAAPQLAYAAAGFQRPDFFQGPRERLLAHGIDHVRMVVRLRRIDGAAALFPSGSAIGRSMDFRTEMAVLDGGVER